ncbi:MAG: cation-transporting P-type ATPase [Bradyrhizobium sp.]|uniref:cation-transporting P-type ATPase n=1 Tax=Bradyrhizobium sp. TaxID=376 RepID=UPI0027306E69|nr:cation-transporting P-type ATPase [Bradyrhizobium sp.]MDP1865537.1 cation-transporting P-type ATPase [Bradyrhizobium sp.]
MDNLGLDVPYWSQDADALSAALGSSPVGLSPEAAGAKLHLVGPNNVEQAPQLNAIRLRQFESPFVLILIFAAVISLALQQWMDSAIILAMPLSGLEMATVIAIVAGYVAATEGAKAWFYRRRPIRNMRARVGR